MEEIKQFDSLYESYSHIYSRRESSFHLNNSIFSFISTLGVFAFTFLLTTSGVENGTTLSIISCFFLALSMMLFSIVWLIYQRQIFGQINRSNQVLMSVEDKHVQNLGGEKFSPSGPIRYEWLLHGEELLSVKNTELRAQFRQLAFPVLFLLIYSIAVTLSSYFLFFSRS